jgi:hypothetical protein
MNPDLLPVLDEITAVLKKHDVAGVIIVGNKTHTDWRLEVEPSWSCTRIENFEDHIGVHFRSKRSEYPSREKQVETLRLTVATFLGFGDCLVKLKEQNDAILDVIAHHIDVSHVSKEE